MFTGVGTSFGDFLDFKKLEDMALADLAESSARGNNKALSGMVYGRFGHKLNWTIFDEIDGYVKSIDQGTVARALAELPGTRMTTLEDGDDPLFEAMERHNNRMKAGKAALKVLFKAQALPVYHNKSTGPAKTKDWE